MTESGAHAPTPFTAAEIREGCPSGRVITIRVDVADGAPVYWRTTFLQSDADRVTISNRQVSAAGDTVGDEATMTESRWEDLRRHALFPADSTTVTSETLSTPLGELDCVRYDVVAAGETQRLWFARSLPGLPVRTATVSGGVEKVTSEVVRDSTDLSV